MAGKVKILIVGNGFGGIYTLKYLHKLLHKRGQVELALIGEKNYFLFSPLLHEVATGSLNPSNVVEPIRQILGCCLDNFYLGKAELVDTKARTVKVGDAFIAYDYLVLATGTKTRFYGVPGAEEHSLPLKSIADAVKIKNRILAQMERATEVSDAEKRKKMLRFVVVGGGPTGVELAAEIAELIKETFAHYYESEILAQAEIVLIQRDKELVPWFGKKIRIKSLDVLFQKGIMIKLGCEVKEVGADYLYLGNGEKLETETVIWTAGIKPQVPEFNEPLEQERDGRLLVNEFFELKGHKNIFALGDVAAFKNNDSYLPALAQVAEREARVLAKNIARLLQGLPPQKFAYRHSGNLLSLGQWMAAGEIAGVTFSGRFAWWLWRTVYLFKYISLRKKIRVAVDWTINLFSPRDISEL